MLKGAHHPTDHPLMTILLIASSTKTGTISIFVIFCAQCLYSAWGIKETWGQKRGKRRFKRRWKVWVMGSTVEHTKARIRKRRELGKKKSGRKPPLSLGIEEHDLCDQVTIAAAFCFPFLCSPRNAKLGP